LSIENQNQIVDCDTNSIFFSKKNISQLH